MGNEQAKASQSLPFSLPKESILAGNNLLFAFLKVGCAPTDHFMLCQYEGCSLRDAEMEAKDDLWSSRTVARWPGPILQHPHQPSRTDLEMATRSYPEFGSWNGIMLMTQIRSQARKSIHRSGLGLSPVVTQQVHSNEARLWSSQEAPVCGSRPRLRDFWP